MSTYKLIQDIEADDKILGPLTLRQFIFALIMGFFLYMCYVFAKNGIYFMLIATGPPALLFGFFAFPFGRDQPTELWALGKMNYYFKPRVRIWNQSGVKELVTVTVPKKVEHVYTDGLNQKEVQSRLSALANTIDSRGWAVKHVDVNVYTPHQLEVGDSDRLINLDSIPQEVPGYDVVASDDILDESNNPIAQQFNTMIDRSTAEHRQQLIDQLNSPEPAFGAPQTDGSTQPWFIAPPIAAASQSIAAATEEDERQAEAALTSELKSHTVSQNVSYGNLRTLWPIGQEPPSPAPDQLDPAAAPANDTPVDDPAAAMAVTEDPAILALANNDDLNVATLAREAQRVKQAGSDQEEVVISLH